MSESVTDQPATELSQKLLKLCHLQADFALKQAEAAMQEQTRWSIRTPESIQTQSEPWPVWLAGVFLGILLAGAILTLIFF